ncbi:MAG: cell division topological specificity factor MinE [Pseudomonadota bacterium]
MSLLDYFRTEKKKSATVARERLQILVAHERAERNKPSYLPQMQRDILDVVRKYVSVDPNAISVNLERDDTRDLLELSIVLPEAPATHAAS